MRPGRSALLLAVVVALLAGACSGDSEVITVYSGRTENLIGPILDDFATETGIDVEVRYGDSADLALLISEEGDRSPADVFISQSPGALGFLAGEGRLATIDDATLALVDPEYRNNAGLWVGMSGRVRVLVYNREMVDESALPTSVFDLTDERFRGLLAVAPTNGSFQDFITAMRELRGDEVAAEWLAGLVANDARTYANNTAIVQAVGRGDVAMGLVNHYYNHRALAEDPSLPSVNYFFPDGDLGSLLIVTAIGVLATVDDVESADRLVQFMLGEEAQRFFSEETFEYPLTAGVAALDELPPLGGIDVATFDLDRLGGGLERTKQLIDESGLESS
jgi:iron(III) transport system substrate-binding protein